MSDKKNWGSTVLGWFVVREEEGAAAMPELGLEANAAFAADQPITADPGGGDHPPAVEIAPMRDAPPAPGGHVDYAAVFAAAGIDGDEQERLDKATGLLRSLPEGTDPALKKQIVEASLKAFGVPIDKIIETGVEEIQALESYIRAGGGDTQTLLQESQQRIAKFEEEIRRIRQVMEERVAEQQSVVRACNERKLDIQRVLEFFGQEAVARVVRDSPKLIDPSSAPGGAGA